MKEKISGTIRDDDTDSWCQVFGITEEEENAILDDALNALEEEDTMSAIRKRLAIKDGGVSHYKAFLYGRIYEMNNTIRAVKETGTELAEHYDLVPKRRR